MVWFHVFKYNSILFLHTISQLSHLIEEIFDLRISEAQKD